MPKEEPMSFVIPFRQVDWNGTLRAFKVVNALLQIGLTVLRSDESSRTLVRGDFVVPVEERIEGLSSYRAIEAFIERMADRRGISFRKGCDITRLRAHKLKEPKIAIYHGSGADMTAFSKCIEKLGFTEVQYVTERHVVNGALRGDDVLIMPGGDSSTMVAALGSEGCKMVNQFIYSGGGYIGACAGAFLPVKPLGAERPEGPNSEEYQKPHKFLELLEYKVLNNFWRSEVAFPIWSYFEHGDMVRVFPFAGDPSSTVRLRVVRRDHPVMFGYDEFIDIHMAGPVIEASSDVEVLAEFHSATPRTEYGLPEKKAWEITRGKAAIVTGRFGRGKLVLFGPHPEEFYEATHPLVGNALFYLTGSGSEYWDIRGLQTSNINLRSPADIGVEPRLSVATAENRGMELLALLIDKVKWLSSVIENLRAKAIDLIPARVLDWFLYALVPLIELIESELAELRDALPKLLASYSNYERLRCELQNYRISQGSIDEFHTDLSIKALSIAIEDIAGYMQESESSLALLPAIMDKATTGMDDILEHVKKMRSGEQGGQDLPRLKEALGRKIMSVLFLLNGGLYFMVPWYDRQYGYADDYGVGTGQSGFAAPLVQLALGAHRISTFSEFASAIVSH